MLRALRLLLIVHTIIAVERELDFGDYVISTDNGILKGIRTTGSFNDELNLSNLGLVGLDENAFDYNLTKLLRLNLTNNWLTSIPEFVFSNLTNLEYLSLSDNNIKCCLENAFVGLRNLKLLDISKNRLTQLESNFFVGLTNSTDILIDGSFISNMRTGFFEGTYPRNKRPSKVEEVAIKRNDTEEDHEFRVKVCYERLSAYDDPWVKRVDIFNTSELTNDCNEAEVDYAKGKLFLRDLPAWKFNENWYGLEDFPINSIDMSSEEDFFVNMDLTSVLKYLPQNIKEVNFSDRYYASVYVVWSRFENEELGSRLNIVGNITLINFKLFEKMNIMVLNLTGNSLPDLQSLSGATLSIVELDLSRNKIGYINPNEFSKVRHLVHLSLSENRIEYLQNQMFSGLSSLQSLDLARNKLQVFDPTPFEDLKNLRHLNLANNRISNIPKGLFIGLDNIEVLDMTNNELSEITGNTLYGLPDTLSTVLLDRNRIQTLGNNSFTRVPKHTLSLSEMGIEIIASGCFNLPRLQELRLSHNGLRHFSSWGNLKGLKRLFLDSNGIEEIVNGATANMGRLEILDLSSNNIKILKNGALFGLPKLRRSVVRLNNTPITLIQGGVFDHTHGTSCFLRNE